MKFLLSTFLSLSLLAGHAQAANVDSCDAAAPCLSISMTLVEESSDLPCGKTCDFHYDVTIITDTSLPGCAKDDVESISHVCWQAGSDGPNGVCTSDEPTAAGFWADEDAKGNPAFTTRVLVPPGGTIYFG